MGDMEAIDEMASPDVSGMVRRSMTTDVGLEAFRVFAKRFAHRVS